MYVRMFGGRLRIGMWDEYERFYAENVDPMTQEIEGFVGRQLLRSTENPDEGVSITVWDTREALANYDKSPRRLDVSKKAEHLYTGEYWVRTYEVRSSTV